MAKRQRPTGGKHHTAVGSRPTANVYAIVKTAPYVGAWCFMCDEPAHRYAYPCDALRDYQEQRR